uniref:HAT C-terminal dimerisation domain-containing protein n=1 Tax=Anopheles dirus TaxID=7168 RepID=A0A182NC58_9DIPT
MKYPPLKLIQDCQTRWNSTFQMVDRMIKNRIPVISCFAAEGFNLKLHEREWVVMDQAVNILRLFDKVTTEIVAEKSISLSKMGVLIRSLKKDGFLGNEVIFEETYEKIVCKIMPTTHETESNENEGIDESSDDEIWECLKQCHRECERTTPRANAASELDKYVSEKNLPVKENPLLWWQQRKNIYPNLFELVIKYLNVPATSVPCERIFSKAGQILTERRNRLASKKLKEILFIQNNYE